MKRVPIAFILPVLGLGSVLLTSCTGFKASNDLARVIQNPGFGRVGPNTYQFEFAETDYDTTGLERVKKRCAVIGLLQNWKSFSLKGTTATLEAPPMPPGRGLSAVAPPPSHTLASEPIEWMIYEAAFSDHAPSASFPMDVESVARGYANGSGGDARHWQSLLRRVGQ